MCKTMKYVFTECLDLQGNHVPNCNGRINPVVIELCEEAEAEGYPPYIPIYNWYRMKHCQPVVTEVREIHNICMWHQRERFLEELCERPDPWGEQYNRLYVPTTDESGNQTSTELAQADNYTYHVQGAPWENPWFREVNWNPVPRPVSLDPPPFSPKDTTVYTHPEVGVVNTLEHPAKWRSADNRPVVLLDVPTDRPRKNSKWPAYICEIQPGKEAPEKPAPEPQPNADAHVPPAPQLPPRVEDTANTASSSSSTQSPRSSSNSQPEQQQDSPQPTIHHDADDDSLGGLLSHGYFGGDTSHQTGATNVQEQGDDLLAGLLNHGYFGGSTAAQAGAGDAQEQADGSRSPPARQRSPSFQPNTPTRPRLPSPPGFQPSTPTKRQRDPAEAEDEDVESPSKRRRTDSASKRNTSSSSSGSSKARSQSTPHPGGREKILLRFPNPSRISRPQSDKSASRTSSSGSTVTSSSSASSSSAEHKHAGEEEDDSSPTPPPSKLKITLKIPPKITLKLKLNRPSQQQRSTRRRQSQAPTVYTAPRTRARARAEQAQQGPMTRARSRALNGKSKKVNYKV